MRRRGERAQNVWGQCGQGHGVKHGKCEQAHTQEGCVGVLKIYQVLGQLGGRAQRVRERRRREDVGLRMWSCRLLALADCLQ